MRNPIKLYIKYIYKIRKPREKISRGLFSIVVTIYLEHLTIETLSHKNSDNIVDTFHLHIFHN